MVYMGTISQKAYKTSRVGESFIGTPDDVRGEWCAGRKAGDYAKLP